MSTDTLTYRRRDLIGYLSLDRTGHANALTPEMIRELAERFDSFASERTLRIVVLEHRGAHFCSGLDLACLKELGDPELKELMDDFAQLLTLIRRCPVPVVALADGKVMGGGAGLAAAADIVLATPRTKLSLPEVTAGMIPSLILPDLLDRIAPGRLKALAMGGFQVAGAELCTLGFADRFSEDGRALLEDQCRRLLAARPEALQHVKSTLPGLADLGEADRQTRVRRHLLAWLGDEEKKSAIGRFAWGERPPWLETMKFSGEGHD